MGAPAGGENPQGFHPFVNPFQFLSKISGGGALPAKDDTGLGRG
jgi:hypothetical protein